MPDPDAESPSPATLPVVLWALPLPFFVVLPGLYLSYYLQLFTVRPVHLLLTTLLSAIVAAVIFVIVRLMTEGTRAALVLTSAWLFVTLMWPAFTAVAAGLPGDLTVVNAVIPVATAVGFLILIARLADRVATPLVLGLAAVAATSALTVGLGQRTHTEPATMVTVSAAPAAGADHPDVVLLVVDAYGDAATLRSRFGYDNAPFLDTLTTHGLEVATDAHADYSATWAAIPAMYALDYPFADGPASEANYALSRKLSGGDNALFDLFHSAGYEIVYFENAYPGSTCTASMDRCIRDGILRTTIYDLSRLTILSPLYERLAPHPFTAQALTQLDMLPDVAAAESDQPRLTVAHVTLPHPPIGVDAECDHRRDDWRLGLEMAPDLPPEDLAKRYDAYPDQVECVNGRITALLDRLSPRDSGTIVMITGDHGSNQDRQTGKPGSEWDQAEIDERFGILLAVGPTEVCRLDDARSPVNAMRRITNCALGTELSDVPGRAFATSDESIDEMTPRLDP